jgi:hypothetical protein
MTDLRYIAERWIAQYGPDTPRMVDEWAAQLDGAPTAVHFLNQIADVARALLSERPANQGGPAAN